MHNIETIATAIASTVRFKQTVDPDVPTLEADLVDPSTARLIYHPLITNPKLAAVAPEAQDTGAEFSAWLREIRLENARQVFEDVFRKKKTDQITKEMLDNLVLFSGTSRLNDLTVKRGRLVGYTIKLLNSNNIKVIIEQLMTQFSAVENFNMYLFHSESPEAIATIPIVHGTPSAAQWTPLGQDLFYRDFTNNIVGGTYFLMYDEDDISGQAINLKINLKPCRSCNRAYYTRYEKWSQYVKLEAVSVSSANKPLVSTEMFDVNKLAFEPDQSWGMNFALSTFCDLTDYIVDHKTLFADVMAKQMVVSLIQEELNTTRSNVIMEKTRDNARFSLQNAEVGGENLVKELEAAKEAVAFELSDIQKSVCMPAVRTKQIRYGAVGNGRDPQEQNGINRNGYYQNTL